MGDIKAQVQEFRESVWNSRENGSLSRQNTFRQYEVQPGPRPDLTFIFAIHCKSRINNMHSKKQVWISRASDTLRIHTCKILLQ